MHLQSKLHLLLAFAVHTNTYIRACQYGVVVTLRAQQPKKARNFEWTWRNCWIICDFSAICTFFEWLQIAWGLSNVWWNIIFFHCENYKKICRRPKAESECPDPNLTLFATSALLLRKRVWIVKWINERKTIKIKDFGEKWCISAKYEMIFANL